jgi:ATP-dependent DNA helicase RecQ
MSRRRRRRHHSPQGNGAQPSVPVGEPQTPIEAAARRLGIARLYPEQERVLETALAGRDVLVVQPTGSGKSACYQVPSMVLPKPVVLISPLLALLRDQHEKLLKRNIACVRLDGTVRGKARKEALKRIAEGGSLLVMTTPETLGNPEAAEALAASGVSLAAVDEAHCISAWGHDFRPAYMQIGERLQALGAPPLMALTATATENVRDDITRYLGLRDPEVVAASPHRANLAFEVLESRGDARLRALMRLSRRLRRPGIVYCSTTREVDNVYMALQMLRIPAHRYHGKMTASERNHEQEMYMKAGRRTVMVATSAFGLGIDKADIRYIVHFQAPASLEQYVQEAGRAGRDGRKANCILLYDPDDRTIHEALLAKSRVRPDQLFRVASAVAAWGGEGRTPTLDALALSAGLSERITEALLAVLEEAAIVSLADGTVKVNIPPDQVEDTSRKLAGQFETLRTQDSRRLDSIGDYALNEECRAVVLRRYFGEDDGARCGLCDICRGRPERPETFWDPIAQPEHRKKRRRRRRRRGRAPGQQGQPGQGKQAQTGGRPQAQPPAVAAPPPLPPPPESSDVPSDPLP